MRNKNLYNSEGKRHGYWEYHFHSNKLWFKRNYINGKRIGYWEWYNFDGSIEKTEFYAN